MFLISGLFYKFLNRRLYFIINSIISLFKIIELIMFLIFFFCINRPLNLRFIRELLYIINLYNLNLFLFYLVIFILFLIILYIMIFYINLIFGYKNYFFNIILLNYNLILLIYIYFFFIYFIFIKLEIFYSYNLN